GALPGAVLIWSVRGDAPINGIAIVIAACTLVAGAVVAAVATAAVSFARILPKQAFGLTTGHAAQTSEQAPSALTDWLHAYLQDLAGKDRAHPLTFGDL